MLTPAGNVVERFRRRSPDITLADVVMPSLQRVSISIPYKHTSEIELGAIIDHAVDAIYAPGKPRN